MAYAISVNAQISGDLTISPINKMKLCQYRSYVNDSMLLNLSNVSSDVINSIAFEGTIGGAPYGPYTWQGTIPPYASNQIQLPAFLEFISDSTIVTLAISKINGVPLTEVDTINFQVYTGSREVPEPVTEHSICLGQSTLLEAPFGFEKYTWSSGDTLHKNQVSQPGEYYLTVVDEYGCIQNDTFNVTHYDYPQTILSSTYSYCQGRSATLAVDSNFTSISWSNGSADKQQDLQQGNYNVSVTDTNGCHYAANATVNELPLPVSDLSDYIETCADTPVVLNAGTHDITVWNGHDSSQSITVTNTGWYSVSIWNNHGCDIQDSTFVKVNDIPEVLIIGDSVICNEQAVTLNAVGSEGHYEWNFQAQESKEIQVLTPGEYTVRVLDTNGCQNAASYIVTKEVVSILSMADTIICDGDAIQLRASTQVDNNLSWPDGTSSEEYQVSSGGTYLVKASSQHCSVEHTIEVTQKYAPTSEFIYDVVDGEVQFTQLNNTAESYQWNFGDSTTKSTDNPTHEYSRIGAFEVTLTTRNVCGISSTKRTVQIGSLGITELNREGILTVYPNPVANGVLNVSFNKWSGSAKLNLYNAVGQLIYSEATTIAGTQSLAIPVTQFQTGTYFLVVELPEQRVVEQLFID